MSYLEYPKQLLQTDEKNQIREINNYLIRLVDQLNHNYGSEGADALFDRVMKYASNTGNGNGALAGITPSQKDKYLNTFNNLKDLIISSAKEVYSSETEPIVQRFERSYTAISDKFGALDVLLDTEIEQSADGLKIVSKKLEGIVTETNNIKDMIKGYAGYIKMGWVDERNNKWGLDIGQVLDSFEISKSDNSTVSFSKYNKFFIRITPDKLSFYRDTEELCYMSENELYFPKANIVGGTIEIGDDGNGKYAFTVNNDGVIKATAGKIGGWSISGEAAWKPADEFWNNALYCSYKSSDSTEGYIAFVRKSTGLNSQGNYGKVFGVRQMNINPGTNKVYDFNAQNWNDNSQYNFYVQTDGKLYARNAVITGEITATSLTLKNIKIPYSSLSGTPEIPEMPDVSGFISKGGVVGSTPSEGATGFKVSKAGLLEASNAIIYGRIYASSGTIGGWDIEDRYLQSTTAAGWRVRIMNAANTSDESRIIYCTDISNGEDNAVDTFYVRRNGQLYASNATITGKITASSGNIAGWTISTNALTYKKTSTLSFGDNDTAFINPSGSGSYTLGGQTKSGWVLGIGSSFGVTKNGIVAAAAMTVSSMYTSNNLYVGDNICLNVTRTGQINSAETGYPIVLQWLNSAVHIGVNTKQLKLRGTEVYVNDGNFSIDIGNSYVIKNGNNNIAVMRYLSDGSGAFIRIGSSSYQTMIRGTKVRVNEDLEVGGTYGLKMPASGGTYKTFLRYYNNQVALGVSAEELRIYASRIYIPDWSADLKSTLDSFEARLKALEPDISNK